MARYASQAEAREKLRQKFDRQPYQIDLDGITLDVARGVYPPDAANSTPMLMQVLREFEPAVALDMGCGSGCLAIHMRRLGAQTVFAADVNWAAVQCTRNNAIRNGFNDIRVVHSDLFEMIPRDVRFELIVFNPFCQPADVDWFGPGGAGAGALLNRFFDQAAAHLAPNGAVLMPYSEAGGPAHDPANIARLRGYDVEEIEIVTGQRGNDKVIVIYPCPAEL